MTLNELGTPELRPRLLAALASLSTSPRDVFLILDFSDADLTDVDAVSELIIASYHEAIEIAPWRRMILEATSFPETNPVKDQLTEIIPRNDWRAWLRAGYSESAVRASLVFGDFAADSAKFKFGSGGGVQPIRHHRYSTPENWFAAGASPALPVAEAMRWVSRQIVESPHFAGPAFSKADAAILERARGLAGPGTASIWRKLNTGHHLTRVIADLGPLFGYTVAPSAVPASISQGSLL